MTQQQPRIELGHFVTPRLAADWLLPRRLDVSFAFLGAASCSKANGAALSMTFLLHRRELRRLMLGDQHVDQLVQGLALDHLVELMQRQADAMIGHAALRKIIGADALRAVAGADLATPVLRALGVELGRSRS